MLMKILMCPFVFLNRQRDTAMFALLIQYLFVSDQGYVKYKIRILNDIHISTNGAMINTDLVKKI